MLSSQYKIFPLSLSLFYLNCNEVFTNVFLAWFFRRFQYRVAQGLVGQVEEEMETDPAETRTALAKLKTLGKKHQAPVSRVGNIHQGIVAWKQDSYICCIRYSQTHYMHVVKVL